MSYKILLFSLNFCMALANPVVSRPDCARDAQDPYEPAVAFTQGAYKGQCVGVKTIRPPQLIAENARQMVLANFYDKGKFWRASVPKGSVLRALFQIVPFDSGVPLIIAAHTQFRFQLKPGAKITLQAQSRSAPETSETTDVIVSSTYTAPEGVEYSAIKSRGGTFGIVTRFLSSYARGKEEIQKDKSLVRQFELKLTDQEKDDLLFLALKRASGDGHSQVYDLLDNNCTTIAFDTLDALRAPPAGVKPLRGSWWNLHDEYIRPSLKGLRERGLIDDKSEIQPMNDEMKFD